MIRVYSYTRFSTPEQAAGDSAKRQDTAIQDYVAQQVAKGAPWVLQPPRQDHGVSGYRAKNSRKGALAEFLAEVRAGVIPVGSVLVVENVDRISRQNPWDAKETFGSIIDSGITVITLHPERVYTRQSVRENGLQFFELGLLMERAHDESRTKAMRLRGSWKSKREAAASGEGITSICPAWIKATKAGHRQWTYELIPERVSVVRRIYRDTLKGIGALAIARALNAEEVPVFGEGKRQGVHWHRSYIAKILNNPAVIGTYTPHVMEYDETHRARRVPLPAIEGFYPAAVPVKTYQQVRLLQRGKDRNPRRGKTAGDELKNIIGGMARCAACGGTMTRLSKTSDRDRAAGKSWEYLVCARAKNRAGCKYRTAPYAKVEAALLEALPQWLEQAPSGTEDAALQARITELDAALDALHDAKERAMQDIRQGKHGAYATLTAIEDDIGAVRASLAEARAEREQYSHALIEERTRELAEAIAETPLDRGRVNVLLRQVFEGIEIAPESYQFAGIYKPSGTYTAAAIYDYAALFGKED